MSPYHQSKIMQCTEEEFIKVEHGEQDTSNAKSVLTIGAADREHTDWKMDNMCNPLDQTAVMSDSFNQMQIDAKAAKDKENTLKQCEVETECKVECDDNKNWNNDGTEKHEKEVPEKDKQLSCSENDSCSDKGVELYKDNDDIEWNNEVGEDEEFVKSENAGCIATTPPRIGDLEQTNRLEKCDHSKCYNLMEKDSAREDVGITGGHMPSGKTHKPRQKKRRKNRRRQKRRAKCHGIVDHMKSCSVPGILQATGGSNKVKSTSGNANTNKSTCNGRRRSSHTMYQSCGGGGGDGGCGGEPPTPPENCWKRKPSCNGTVNKKQRPKKLITRQESHSSLPSPLVHGTPYVSRESPCFSFPLIGDSQTHDSRMTGLRGPAFENIQLGSESQMITEREHYPIQREQSLTDNAASVMEVVAENEVNTSDVAGDASMGSVEETTSYPSYTGPVLEQAPSFRPSMRPHARVPVTDNNKAAFIDHLMDKPYHTGQELVEDTQVETRNAAEVEADDMWSQWIDVGELPNPGRKVGYGEKRHLRSFLQKWKMLQRKLNDGRVTRAELIADQEEGVIFVEGLRITDGHYREGEEYWQMESLLGSGTFGKVYLCKDNTTQYEFVVKKVGLHNFNPNEALIWSELTHPGIVRLFGVIRTGETICFYSASVANRNLKSLVDKGRVLSQGDALLYLEQLLVILVYVHDMQVLHKDLKPENILVTGEGRCLLIDWGLAKFFRKGQKVKSEREPEGTQQYMAPEVARSEDHDYGADIWSLMCVCIQLISGSPPWIERFGNVPCLFFKIGMAEAPPLEDIPEDTHPAVHSLLAEGMTINPNDRPSAARLLEHQAFNLIHELRGVEAVNVLNIAQCTVPPGSDGSEWKPYFAEAAGNDRNEDPINTSEIDAANLGIDQIDINCPFKSDLDTTEDQASYAGLAPPLPVQTTQLPDLQQAEPDEELKSTAVELLQIGAEESPMEGIAMPQFSFCGLPSLQPNAQLLSSMSDETGSSMSDETESSSHWQSCTFFGSTVGQFNDQQHQPCPSNRPTEGQSNQDFSKDKAEALLHPDTCHNLGHDDYYASVDSNVDIYGPSLTETNENVSATSTSAVAQSSLLPLTSEVITSTSAAVTQSSLLPLSAEVTTSTSAAVTQSSPLPLTSEVPTCTSAAVTQSSLLPLTSEVTTSTSAAVMQSSILPLSAEVTTSTSAAVTQSSILPLTAEVITSTSAAVTQSSILPLTTEVIGRPPASLGAIPKTYKAANLQSLPGRFIRRKMPTIKLAPSFSEAFEPQPQIPSRINPTSQLLPSHPNNQTVQHNQMAQMGSTLPTIEPALPMAQNLQQCNQMARMETTVPPFTPLSCLPAVLLNDPDRQENHQHRPAQDRELEATVEKICLVDVEETHNMLDSLASLGGPLQISGLDESQVSSGSSSEFSGGVLDSPEVSINGGDIHVLAASTPIRRKTYDFRQFLDDDDIAPFQGLEDTSLPSPLEDIPVSSYTNPPMATEGASYSSYATAPPCYPGDHHALHRTASMLSAEEIELQYISLAESNLFEHCAGLDNPDAQLELMTEAIELRSQLSQSSRNAAATPKHVTTRDGPDKYDTSGVYSSSLNHPSLPLMSYEYPKLEKQLSAISSTSSNSGAGIKVTVNIGDGFPICIMMRYEQSISDLAKGISGKIPHHVSKFCLQTEDGETLSEDQMIGTQDISLVMTPLKEGECWAWCVERCTGTVIYPD